ncbi:Aste57867_14532 [Aphanomyces stellatus]|uniref:Aste57867_14532 protein n=1 Tax=Aphanomyces stellatus TaxID=120398 RepID=A0A485KHA7_9STRA|nr:hypothetical protein As57867_014478 [Aphanomyces stellatus]KAF0711570.1 hypothetical protein As57867_005186 [Aphanomyces stellatus]VFT82272.1 Aste57867_5199 [Aphanomyces stellatus]VFT91354.1 Aste57867_14532 [Aphanomyces stellatus]
MPSSTRYWIGVVSKSHVDRGVAGGFAQVCHGKAAPWRRVSRGDHLIYYSPKTDMTNGTPLQAFTALGCVASDESYQVEMTPSFHPHRVDVVFDEAVRPTPIHPLLPTLSFIKDKKKWGMIFRRGLFEIPEDDFQRIVTAMGRK